VPDGSRRDRGQSLTEFAIVIPFLIVLFMGVVEFALAMGATLGVNRASQNAAHVAASAGALAGADCLILQSIEGDVTVPNDPAHILDVVISRQALAGNVSYAQQTWVRTGSTDCELADGSTVELPYTLTVNGDPEAQRCTVLSGCPLMTPARSTVDNVGVQIRYEHQWVTPLEGAMGLIGATSSDGDGWEFEQRNVFRMEPTL
jgi:Flp pilus assembly protein TadG